MIKCIIFDCDGTLVDSEFLGHFCMEVKLAEIGIHESAESMKEEFRGWKLAEILKVISSRNPGTEFPQDFIPEYRLALTAMFEEKLQPILGVEAALQQISLPMCVASSGPMFKIRNSLQITGLVKYFGNLLFSAYDLNCWKPDPGLFLHTAAEMGFKPKECLVIEDSFVGVKAALAAGMKVICFNPESIDLKITEEFKEIHRMSELPEAIAEFSLSH